MEKSGYDVKFILITLLLAAGVIATLFFISSSSVGAEELVTEYMGDAVQTTEKPSETQATTVSTTILTTVPTTVSATTASITMPAVNAAAIGSSSDPLITLSYLRNILMPELESIIMAKITGVEITAPPPTQTESSAPVNTSYVVIELKKNDRIRSKNDSMEIIVRPGSTAIVLSPYTDQGLADLTDGKEILNGKETPINHILLVPRADNRGIMITSSKAYVMVRGDYEIY